MLLETLSSSARHCRTYLVVDQQSREALVVDPLLDEVDQYLDTLRARGLALVGVVETHTHSDHLSGAAALAHQTGAPILMHHQAPKACVTRRLRDGDVIHVGEERVRVMSVPGHTYDSVALLFDDVIVVGDLFEPGPRGHGDELCADPEAFRESLARLSRLEPRLRVHSGHDEASAGDKLLGEALQAAALRADIRPWPVHSRLGSDFRAPSDNTTFDVLRHNFACVASTTPSSARTHAAQGDVLRIGPDELVALLSTEENIHVVDVRSAAEYFSDGLGQVPGSLLIPLEHVEAEAEALEQLTGMLVLSCRTTARSEMAAALLRRRGLNNVRVLEGGIIGWRADGHPVDSVASNA